MSEASSYHHNYHGQHDLNTRYYADPGEHSSGPVRRNRYDRDNVSPRRVRDVSWISQRSPSPINDPYARWYPPPPDPEDLPTPVFPDQPLPMAHSSPMMGRTHSSPMMGRTYSSPMMGRTPSPGMRMPSPMIGEYMTVEEPEDEEDEEDEEDDDEEDEDEEEEASGGPRGD
ncbi:hypothetical protein F4604DRAFT_1082660 [Suillus subluteus]|nr:hypothetical protein F4604DRAFT_1082660 [Suillus subluteus]